MLQSEYSVFGPGVPHHELEAAVRGSSVHAGGLSHQGNAVLHQWREGPGCPHDGRQAGLQQGQSLPG